MNVKMPTIRDMQEKEIIMMLEIDALLKDNNIQYWLLGGSVLGSIRHQGFIPWDDDMDIGIMRKDVDKTEILIASLKDYVYESIDSPMPFTFPNLPIGHIHYVDENYPISNSPTIDVFALDGMPANVFLRKIQRFWADVYLLCMYQHTSTNRGYLIKLATTIALFITPKIIFNFLQKTALKIITHWDGEKSPMIVNLFGAWGKREIFNRDMFDGYTIGKFENMLLPLPVNPDIYLKSLYGDYMRLPPPEERTPKHRQI
ncbi:MAG: LicD family protein [Dysgonamonadaceae bacterium]|jgi:lipopolysaccharide cholinephosphotransferase|nr:LicD family protein [Dysgonamonadaceae bacterium]